MQKNIYEILEEVQSATTDENKVLLLRKYACPALEAVLFYGYRDDIHFYRLTAPPNYKPSDAPEGMGMSNIHMEWKKFRYFIPGYTECDRITYERKDQMLLQLLESLESKEADVVISMMGHTMQVKYGLLKSVVRQAFPKMILGE